MLPVVIALAAVSAYSQPVAGTSTLDAFMDPVPFTATTPLVSAAAEEDSKRSSAFSYTYIEVGATRFNVDTIDDTADIYYGRASLNLLGFMYVFGEYQNQSVDFANTKTDRTELGVGAHFAIMPKLDLFGEVGWLYNNISSDVSNIDDTTNGYEALAGARWMVMDWSDGGLELNGKLGYIDLKNQLASDDSSSIWGLGARVHFLKHMSIGTEYAMQGSDDEVSLNARFSF
jgi:hypothetical protein